MQNLYHKTPITKKEIEEIERDLKISFPQEIQDFYLKNNGGRYDKNLFEHEDDGYKIHNFLSLKHGPGTIESAFKSAFLDNELMPKNLVPFAIDAGGDFFCFSIADEDFGAIIFFDSEYYDEPDRCLVPLADSFSDFIAQLIVDEE